ncbi:PASTA domain-containing protein [Arthrobacter bambusae]|uniref:PASTA domain-containing protein n=1 Tax=Arthrobacter sp. NPDC058127 TaxID=3346351 RepID=UPI0036ECB7A8
MSDTLDDDRRAADFVLVPDVVGERFLKAREIAGAAGLTLANPDPDGPPISELAWRRNTTVQAQSPDPGSLLYRYDSLRVWLRSDLEPDMARKPDSPPPSVDSAHAVPEVAPRLVELAGEQPTGEAGE